MTILLGMHPLTVAAIHDELEKIAAESETPASKANAFFGLPVGPARKRNTRSYEQGNDAAQPPDGTQPPASAASNTHPGSV